MVAYGLWNAADPLAQLSLPSMKEVARDFWQSDIVLPQSASIFGASDRTAYHGYAVRQWTSLAGQPDCPSVTVRTYAHLVAVIRQLQDDMPKEDLLDSLNANMALYGPDKFHENSIKLAARLLAMLKVGRAENQVAARGYLEWQTGTFRDLIEKRFCVNPVLESSHVRFPKTFDIWSLNAVAGLSIEFTDNIADHLLLVNDDTTLLIFHHVTFLEYQNAE